MQNTLKSILNTVFQLLVFQLGLLQHMQIGYRFKLASPRIKNMFS